MDLAVHFRRAVRALRVVWALGFHFCRRKEYNKPAVNYCQVQPWSVLGECRWLGYWLFASVIFPVLFTLSFLIGAFAFPSDLNKMESSLLRFVFWVLEAWGCLCEEVFSFARSLFFSTQSWDGFPFLEYWLEVMCGMLQPVGGVPSIQAHSISGSSGRFTSLADLFQAIYILLSKFLTSHCRAAGRGYFGKGSQNPRETCVSTQCWRQAESLGEWWED